MVVNSLLYTRLEEHLTEQQTSVNAEGQAEVHTHIIAVKAEIQINELKAVLQATQPSACKYEARPSW